LLQRDDFAARLEARMQLPGSDIDGVNTARAALQEQLGKPAGRRADVETDAVRDVEMKVVERRRKLDPAARDIRVFGAAIESDALRTGTPSARTKPAAIAACARARLS
jgi:hypothetical protein